MSLNTISFQWAKVLVVLPALIFGSQAISAQSDLTDEDREGIIFERQQIMQDLERDGEALGDIAAGLRPASELPATVRSIAQNAQASLDAFETVVPGGRSKPEVWSNHEDFRARMAAFVASTQSMALTGEAGNLIGVTEVMADVMNCRACHTDYREPARDTQ